MVEQAKEGGHYIVPTSVKPGTTLYIETNEQIYEIVARKEGFFVSSYGKMFRGSNKKCFIDGCVHGISGILFADLILQGMHLALVIEDVGRYTTGRVLSVGLKGKGWKYDAF